MLRRLNHDIVRSGRCLVTFRKDTLPQFSTRVHGVITHKTTVTNLHLRQHLRPHKVYLNTFIHSNVLYCLNFLPTVRSNEEIFMVTS
jgi:hypothetical protein